MTRSVVDLLTRDFMRDTGVDAVYIFLLKEAGTWSVSVELSDRLLPVPDSEGQTPEESIRKAIARHKAHTMAAVVKTEAWAPVKAGVYSWQEVEPPLGCFAPTQMELAPMFTDQFKSITGVRAVGLVSTGLFVAVEHEHWAEADSTIRQLLTAMGYKNVKWGS